MINITCDDLVFDDVISAKDFVNEHSIKLFMDDGDIILCYESTADNIENQWEKVSTKTALYFQSNLIDEVIARNLILVYLSKDEINIGVKKTIQLDTYCCRKIVRSGINNLDDSIKELMLFNTEQLSKPEVVSLRELIKIKHPEVFELIKN
ncbi:ABC-three component system middle component 1 [Vibrio sp. 10N.247.311.64]|uniref:ABC-three component system middle component 1 n=1 Tax=Vibrio sp. 10N.247.311.64 TaxID=3229997 RepID=UPI00354C4C29